METASQNKTRRDVLIRSILFAVCAGLLSAAFIVAVIMTAPPCYQTRSAVVIPSGDNTTMLTSDALAKSQIGKYDGVERLYCTTSIPNKTITIICYAETKGAALSTPDEIAQQLASDIAAQRPDIETQVKESTSTSNYTLSRNKRLLALPCLICCIAISCGAGLAFFCFESRNRKKLST